MTWLLLKSFVKNIELIVKISNYTSWFTYKENENVINVYIINQNLVSN